MPDPSEQSKKREGSIMSNRLFQGLVYQMRDTINRTIGVVDENATIIACSDLTKIGEPNDFLAIDLGENNDLFVWDGVTYKPFGSKKIGRASCRERV